jgi:hypothetical protein
MSFLPNIQVPVQIQNFYGQASDFVAQQAANFKGSEVYSFAAQQASNVQDRVSAFVDAHPQLKTINVKVALVATAAFAAFVNSPAITTLGGILGAVLAEQFANFEEVATKSFTEAPVEMKVAIAVGIAAGAVLLGAIKSTRDLILDAVAPAAVGIYAGMCVAKA